MTLAIESGGIAKARVKLAGTLSRAGISGVAIGMSLLYLFSSFDAGARVFVALAAAGGLAWAIGFGSLFGSFIAWFARTPVPGAVTVDDTHIEVHRGAKAEQHALGDVASAYVVHRPVGNGVVWTVEIVLASGDTFAVRTSGEGDATALVTRLGFGPGGKRVTIDLSSPERRLLHPLLGIAAYYAGGVFAFPLVLLGGVGGGMPYMGLFNAACMVLLYSLFKRLARGPKVTVGTDGIAVVRGRKARFVAKADLLAVDQPTAAATPILRTRSGPVLLNGVLADAPRLAAAARIAYERLAAPPAPVDRAALFERGGRSVREWRENVRRVVEEASYRDAGASLDDAGAVLKSAASTPEQRVGAALALRVSGQPAERIRVAAEGLADEHLRVAVETAAAEDDALVERALAKMAKP